MAYVRVKRIKKNGKEYSYAYLVENRWKKRVGAGSKKGARQKVKGYLGKVHSFPKALNKELISHFAISDVKSYVSEKGVNEIVKDLARLELVNHGFAENGDFYSNADLAVYMGNDFFIKRLSDESDRKIVIAMNEGYFCKETFEKLLNFKASGNEKEVGLALANAILGAGLSVPKEVFVEMFNKVIER